MKAKNWDIVLKFAEDVASGKKRANKYQYLSAKRFLNDLKNPEYEINKKDAEFCIQIIENTLCHQQGESLEGEPLRGTPFLLQPWQKFIIYNVVGFRLKGTDILRFHECLIFVPRKNGKSSFAAALAWALSLLFRRSGSKVYIASGALMQSLESFNFLKYNIQRMGEDKKHGGLIDIKDSYVEHSMSADFGDGSFFIRALAANPDTQDSLNMNIAILDRLLSHMLVTT